MAQNKIGLLERLDIEVNRQGFKTVNMKRDASVDLLWACERLLPNYYKGVDGKGLSPESKKWISTKKPDAFEIGGWGSGKTYDLCAKTVINCWLNAPLPWLFLAQTKSNSEATTEASLQKLLNAEKIRYTCYDREAYTIYELDFGDGIIGRLELTSGHSEVSIAGPTFAGVSVDECFLVKKKVINVAIARARDPKAVLNQVLFASTIERAKMDWGFEIVDKKFKGDKNTEKVVKSTLKAKHATKEFIDRMKRWLDPKMQQVYLEGIDVNLNGDAAYHAFNSDSNLSYYKPHEIKQLIKNTGKGVLSFDFNVGYMCANYQIDIGIKTFQLLEWKVPSSNTHELAEAIAEFWIAEGFNEEGKEVFMLVTGDASGRAEKSSSRGMNDYKIIKEVFKEYGLKFVVNVPDSNPLVYDRVLYVNNLFDKKLFFINETCTESIKDRELIIWKQKLEGVIMDKSDPERTHLADSGDYGVYTRIRRGVDKLNDARRYKDRISTGPARRSYGV